MNKEVIYVGDPMCSWCYGFTHPMRGLRAKYGEKANFTLMMGGLRPDGTHVADDAYTAFLREHWQEISQRTGQPFSFGILDRTGWIYDTEKACRAVVAVRLIRPELQWAYFAAAQTGFYRDNHDPNDPDSFARIAETFGIAGADFLAAYASAEAAEATQADFRAARRMGVSSFPTVVVRDDRGTAALTIGYRPLEALEGPFLRWLES